MGPDGMVYICNDGGFDWMEIDGLTVPGHTPHPYTRGSIQRVNISTGKVETLYTQCDGHYLKGPNDIVFDGAGGFWFTDFGKVYERSQDRTGIFYAKTDGSMIKEAVFPMNGPNGIGLAPGDKKLYVAETMTARLLGMGRPQPRKTGPETGCWWSTLAGARWGYLTDRFARIPTIRLASG